MSISTKLKESLHSLSNTERVIAYYLLENLDALGDTTITKVAQACRTSKSMVVQLCKRLGFRGFKDFRSQLAVELALAERLPPQSPEEAPDSAAHHTVGQLSRDTVLAGIKAIQNTFDLFADSAMELQSRLAWMGLNARFHLDIQSQLLEAASLTEHSVVIVLSYSGRDGDMIRACALAQSCGATVISLTRYGRNPVSDQADITLFVAGSESPAVFGPMSSRLTMTSMVDVVLSCLIHTLRPQIQPLLKRAEEIAETRRRKVSG